MKIVEEFHEFTWDMVRTLPKCYYYYINKIPFELRCKAGLSEIYYFVDNARELQRFDAVNDTISYNNEPPHYVLNEWAPPPLKQYYGDKVKFNKPTVVVQNKFSKEWFSGPYNYFSIELLEELFNILQDRYDIIYIRPTGHQKNYYEDENEILFFRDYEMIYQKFPKVYTIEQFIKKYNNYSYNALQFILEATADKHITVSGGNACISSYFGGDVIIFDSPEGKGAGRGIWKTDSWLSMLGGANIYGYNNYDNIIKRVKENW